MTSNQQFLSKGFYQYAQSGNPVLVKDYIFTRQEGKKCLLVRFSNDLEYTVDEMEFTVVQMDAAGKILKNTRVEYVQMQLEPGTTYVHNAGIVVDDFCTDFRIVLKKVKSGQYVYEAHKGQMTVRYIRKPTAIETSNVQTKYIFKPSVQPRRFGKPRAAVLLATVALVAMLALNALTIGWEYYDFKYGDQDEQATDAEETVETGNGEY